MRNIKDHIEFTCENNVVTGRFRLGGRCHLHRPESIELIKGQITTEIINTLYGEIRHEMIELREDIKSSHMPMQQQRQVDERCRRILNMLSCRETQPGSIRPPENADPAELEEARAFIQAYRNEVGD